MRGAGGQVEYVKIMQDFDGRPKVLNPLQQGCQGCFCICPHNKSIPFFLQGFGVCEFTSRQDAQDAIEKLDQSELQGTPESFSMCIAVCS